MTKVTLSPALAPVRFPFTGRILGDGEIVPDPVVFNIPLVIFKTGS